MTDTAFRAGGIDVQLQRAMLEAKLFGHDSPVSIGRYTILDRLGSGGMGIVYRCRDPELGREVAVKVSLRHVQDTGHRTLRMQREAKALARLSHPNVVAVYETGVLDDQPWIAMELVEGQNLRQWLERDEPPTEQIVDAFVQAGRGLAAAHEHGIVHRDFKPDNVLIGADGRARVLDFGIVRIEDRASRPPALASEPDASLDLHTLSDAVVGTLLYMAPEQHDGAAITPAADQYAFCLSLYESLLGHMPLRGRTPAAIAREKQEGVWRSTRAIPRHLRSILRRGLSPRAHDRFPAMADVVTALERRPRRRGRLAVAGALAGGVAFVFTGDRSEAPDDCEVAAHRLDETWSDARAASLRAHLAGIGGSYGSQTADHVQAELERFVEQWRSSHATVCTGEAAPERVRCLERSLDRFGALLDVLAQLDVEGIAHAVDAPGDLPRPNACLEEPSDTAWTSPVGPAATELRRRLARAEALLAAARHDEGLAEAQGAARDGEELDDVPAQARAWWAIGAVHNAKGDLREALSAFEHAFYLASKAGDRGTATHAATNLAGVTTLLGDLETSERWIEHARALCGNDTISRAEIEAAIASNHEARAQWEDALRHQRRAVELLVEALGPEHPRVAIERAPVGAQLRFLARYDEAKAELDRSLEDLEAALGPDHPALAGPLAGLTEVAVHVGDLEAARRHVERTLDLVGAVDRRAAGAGFDLGVAYAKAGDLDRAEQMFRQSADAYAKSLGPDHARTGWAIYSLGNVAYMRRDYVAARDEYARAAAILEATLGSTHPELGLLHTARGQVASGLDDQAAAIAHFDLAHAALRADLGDDHPYVANALANRGQAQRRNGDLDAAHASYSASLRAYERSLGRVDLNTTFAISGLGDIAVARGQYDEAVALLEEVLASRRAAAASPVDIASAQFGLARALHGTGEIRRARELARLARATYASAGDGFADSVDEVTTWLESR